MIHWIAIGIGLQMLIIYLVYTEGYVRGYGHGIDYGRQALKEYSDHVTQGLRSR